VSRAAHAAHRSTHATTAAERRLLPWRRRLPPWGTHRAPSSRRRMCHRPAVAAGTMVASSVGRVNGGRPGPCPRPVRNAPPEARSIGAQHADGWQSSVPRRSVCQPVRLAL